MKLMKIFGMVFALHVALACVLVLIQGCRSTPSRAPENDAAATAVEPEPSNWSSQSSSLAPAPVDSAFGAATPVAAGPLSSLSPAERERAAPTRPANPGAFISTSTPTALAPPPAEPATYVIRSGDSLWKIAKAYGTTSSAIQKLNPTVKASSLRPGMIIKVPGTAASNATEASSTPAASFAMGPGPAATAAEAAYIVRSGDSLSKVAARNGTTVAALREANNLRSDVIQIGQELKIPNRVAEAGSTAFGVGDAPLPPPGTSAPAGDNAGQVTIVLQRGDTLGAIARKFGVTVSDLMAENNVSDPTKVRVGQTLVIPGFHAVGTGAVPLRTPAVTTAPVRGPAPVATPPTATMNSSPPILPPPLAERPSGLDGPGAVEEAPPVQPIEGDPMPAP